jgi:hypothetical protein
MALGCEMWAIIYLHGTAEIMNKSVPHPPDLLGGRIRIRVL